MILRKPLHTLGVLVLTAFVTVGLASPAGAAQTCEPSPGSTTCFSTSTDTVTVEQPIPGTTEDIETFRTRIIVETGAGTTYDVTVDAASDSSSAADATASAKASAIGDGLEVTGVETSSPLRTLASTTQDEVITADREELTAQTEIFIGPATAPVGPDRSEPLYVPPGASLVNINTRTTKYVNVVTNTTNTYLTTATITIVAVAPDSPSPSPPATVSTSTTSTTTPSGGATTSSTVPPVAVSPGSTHRATGELARTGTSTGTWTTSGITLVLAGAAVLHLSRRSTRHHQPAPK